MAAADKYAPVPDDEEAANLRPQPLVQLRFASTSGDCELGSKPDKSDQKNLPLDQSTEAVAARPLLKRATSSAVLQNDASHPSVDTTSKGSVIHVRGVRAGADAVKELVRIFTVFGTVEDVVVRERFTAPKDSADADAPPLDTSWALVTMSSSAEVDIALRDGVQERMDPTRPIIIGRFSKAIATRRARAQ